MKQYLPLAIVFCFTLVSPDIIDMEKSRGIFVQRVYDLIPKNITLPKNHINYAIKGRSRATVLFQGIKLNKMQEVQKKYNLPDSIVTQIEGSQYSEHISIGVLDKISSFSVIGQGQFSESIGAAFRSGDMAYFSLITVKTHLVLRIPYNRVCKKECKRFLGIKISCSDKCENIPRDNTPAEKKVIQKIVEYYSSKELIKYVETLKTPGYQAYFSPGSGVYSSDGKYVAYLTDFGCLAIGKKENIKSVEEVRYFEILWTDNTYHKKKIGSTITRNTKSGKVELNNGHPENLNFIGEGVQGIMKFKDLAERIKKGRKEKGAYFMKVLNTGEMIIYNNNTQIWSSQSGNKGQSPYDFKVEGTSLSLIDSNQKEIFHVDPIDENCTLLKRGLNFDLKKNIVSTGAFPDNTEQTAEFRISRIEKEGTVPLFSCSYNNELFMIRAKSCNPFLKIGKLGYIYANQEEGMIPVYNCFNQQLKDFIITSNEKCSFGYVKQQKLGYAFEG